MRWARVDSVFLSWGIHYTCSFVCLLGSKWTCSCPSSFEPSSIDSCIAFAPRITISIEPPSIFLPCYDLLSTFPNVGHVPTVALGLAKLDIFKSGQPLMMMMMMMAIFCLSKRKPLLTQFLAQSSNQRRDQALKHFGCLVGSAKRTPSSRPPLMLITNMASDFVIFLHVFPPQRPWPTHV